MNDEEKIQYLLNSGWFKVGDKGWLLPLTGPIPWDALKFGGLIPTDDAYRMWRDVENGGKTAL